MHSAVEGAFLLLVAAAYLPLAGHVGLPGGSIARPLIGGAIVVGAAWKLLARRGASILLPPLLLVSLLFAPISLLGALSLGSLAFVGAGVSIAVGVATLFLIRTWGKTIFAVLLVTAVGSAWGFVIGESPSNAGDCDLKTAAIYRFGGELVEGGLPHAIACGMRRDLYVTHPRSGTIENVTPESRVPVASDAPSFALAASPEGDAIVCATSAKPERSVLAGLGAAALGSGGESLTRRAIRFDIREFHEIETASMEWAGGCGRAVSVGWDPIRQNFVILCAEGRSLLFPKAGRDVEEIARRPSGMAINNLIERAYVTDLFGVSAVEVDLATLAPLRKIPTGVSSAGVAVSSDGLTLFIGRPIGGTVDVFDAVTLKYRRSLPVMRGVGIVRVDASGRYVFAASPWRGSVAVYDTKSDRMLGPYPVGRPIRDMVYCELTRQLYVSMPCGVRYLTVPLLEEEAESRK
ncbi:hypothetical protein K8I61_20795 [bacterium]|nr:hypothetical protein [bacterium]